MTPGRLAAARDRVAAMKADGATIDDQLAITLAMAAEGKGVTGGAMLKFQDLLLAHLKARLAPLLARLDALEARERKE